MPSTDTLPAERRSTDFQVIGELPDWGAPYATELLDTLASTENPFPCTFAVSAARKQGLRFGFVDDLHDRGSWEVLPGMLSAYLDVYRQISRETSLVVLFRPEAETGSMEGYYEKFWEVLQFLHERDQEPWPGGVPRSTEDSEWEFGFGGTPIFVVCNTPAHVRRKSRANPCFMITFQPRWVFEHLGPETSRGEAARRVIRNRLRAFDEGPPSPELGYYGDPQNREWRQYFLFDDNAEPVPACPFRHK
jgi:uncharacterized protein